MITYKKHKMQFVKPAKTSKIDYLEKEIIVLQDTETKIFAKTIKAVRFFFAESLPTKNFSSTHKVNNCRTNKNENICRYMPGIKN